MTDTWHAVRLNLKQCDEIIKIIFIYILYIKLEHTIVHNDFHHDKILFFKITL